MTLTGIGSRTIGFANLKLSDRSAVEQIITRLKLVAPLNQFERPQPAEGIIEPAAAG